MPPACALAEVTLHSHPAARSPFHAIGVGMSASDAQAQRICVIGGGAAGVGLVWSLAKATQLGLNRTPYQITLVHDGLTVGGHSLSVPVTLGGSQVHIDCGVQMLAPTMY